MLTTKEFIEKVEDTGYKTEKDPYRIYIYVNEEELERKVPCASVDHKDRFVMSCSDRLKSAEVFALMTEYAQTPSDKREKEGYLWIKNVGKNGASVNTHTHRLVYEESDNVVFFTHSNKADYLNLQTEYTESEKEEIEKKTGVPLVFLEE